MTGLRCHFCGQTVEQVAFLMVSDSGAAICDRCSDIASREIGEQRAKASKGLIERAVDKGRD
jgi:ribosome-binding protein aMBF1 (putative translation factor)